MEPAAVLNLEHTNKNKLQEFSQRAMLSLPVYQTVNEGTQHLPQFRSSVDVDGTRFVSPCVFTRRKQAEQYVSKFALESILTKIREEGVPLINNDIGFCKSILHEYATKMKLELPKYTTSRSEGSLPVFISTVVFNGNTYSGDAGRNKRDAEQLGARVVIQWILGQPDTIAGMAEIIKSKAKLFNAFRKSGGIIAPQDIVAPQDNNVQLEVSGDMAAKENNMHTDSTNGKKLAAEHTVLPAAAEHAVLLAAGDPKEEQVGGESNTVLTLQNNNQAEGPTNGPVNVASDSVIQVKEEDPSEGPSTLLANLQTPNPSSSGKCKKRSGKRNKHKQGSDSKKLRTDE